MLELTLGFHKYFHHLFLSPSCTSKKWKLCSWKYSTSSNTPPPSPPTEVKGVDSNLFIIKCDDWLQSLVNVKKLRVMCFLKDRQALTCYISRCLSYYKANEISIKYQPQVFATSSNWQKCFSPLSLWYLATRWPPTTSNSYFLQPCPWIWKQLILLKGAQHNWYLHSETSRKTYVIHSKQTLKWDIPFSSNSSIRVASK